MEITDSELRDIVRQSFLTFEADMASGEPLAVMVGHDDLVMALIETARASSIEFREESISAIAQRGTSVEVTLSSGETLAAGVLAACDGAQSIVRERAKIPVVSWDYQREAIVATVQTERDHEGCAVQHFLPAGTLALLPLPSRRFSIVWVEKPEDAKRLCEMPKEDFEFELQRRAGHAFGKLSVVEGPQHYPLRLQIARRFHAERLVLLGDAAHTTHPLAGQGLNLGLRDVGFLMQQFADAARLGLDIGTAEQLEGYERSRRAETVVTLGTADTLFGLFTTPAARALRDAGLGIVDCSTPIKSALMRQAAGEAGELPELLRREPVDV